MKSLWRRAQIITRLGSFIWSLVVFFRNLAKANKEEDNEAKRKSILEAITNLVKSIPYDLPGLLVLEFKEKGDNE